MLRQLGDCAIALTAAKATFALKAGEWFRRGRLLMVSPVHGDYRRCQAEIPLIVLSKFPRPALLSCHDLTPSVCGLKVYGLLYWPRLTCSHIAIAIKFGIFK